LPCSATDEAWRLLSSYLERYPSQNSLYHRCVINKLLAHGIPLPNWLINSYKVRTGRGLGFNGHPLAATPSQLRESLCLLLRLGAGASRRRGGSREPSLADVSLSAWQKVDAAELLRLYLNYDLLEEAAELVLEYVDAVLGKGHQYFGIEVSAPTARDAAGTPFLGSGAVPTAWVPALPGETGVGDPSQGEGTPQWDYRDEHVSR